MRLSMTNFFVLLFAVGVFFTVVIALNKINKTAEEPEVSRSSLSIENMSSVGAVAYVAFGSDSKVNTSDWRSFCKVTSALNCSFVLGKNAMRDLPTKGRYLNATFSFDAPVACQVTKAEVNINNPKWYDTMDVSLVDGYSNKVSILVSASSTLSDASALSDASSDTSLVLGPPNGKDGNEKVFGLFPYGCDICVERSDPPCGIQKGRVGCKTGTQYEPDVLCQYQGSIMGGGQKIRIRLHP